MYGYCIVVADESVDSLKKKTQERDRNERVTQTTMDTAENNTRKRQEWQSHANNNENHH